MNRSEHHKTKFEKTAHYYTLGKLTTKTQYVWLICHGYGQAADRFIQKFDGLDLDKHFIIAPEALSRFYWGGFTGDVVASWMTSKDRLDEINDYTNYLHQITKTVVPSDHNSKWVMLGFSQGVATIMRYLDEHRPVVEKVVLWAGVFPPDIDYDQFRDYLNRSRLHFFYGDQDEFITSERFDQEQEKISKEGIDLAIHTFQGQHKVEKEVLEDFVKREFKY